MPPIIGDNQTVLFQGDSITDAGREGGNLPGAGDNELGDGYVALVAKKFTRLYPEKNVRFINRGWSGDGISQMLNRWKEDCIDLKPDWVSILIGINDTSRRYWQGQVTTQAQFIAYYRFMLEWTIRELNAGIILCEPFLLHDPPDRLQWREDLDPKIKVVRKLVREYQTLYVPLDRVFRNRARHKPPHQLLWDGIHPTKRGHAIIAQKWMQVIKAIE